MFPLQLRDRRPRIRQCRGGVPAAAVERLERRLPLTFYTVDTVEDVSADDGRLSLREALTAANTNAAFFDAPAGEADGLDRIRLPRATFRDPLTLRSTLAVTDGVVVLGGRALFLPAGDGFDGPAFDVRLPPGEQVILENFNVEGGFRNRAAGGILRFTGSDGTSAAPPSAALGLRGTRFFFGVSNATGGSLYLNGGRTVAVDTVISRNRSGLGGGGVHLTGGGRLSLTGGSQTRNTAGTDGGFLLNDGGTARIDDGRLLRNEAGDRVPGGSGGAVHTSGTGYTAAVDTAFLLNTAAGAGGAVANADARVAFRGRTEFDRNEAGGGTDGRAGGAVFSSGVTLVAGGSLFQDNRAAGGDGRGGAVFVDGGRFVMRNAVLRDNAASADGGAVAVGDANPAEVTLTRSTFLRNVAGPDGAAAGVGNGGAVFAAANPAARLLVGGGRFLENIARAGGGAVFAGTGVTVNLGGAVYDDNTARAGGAVLADGARLDVDRSVLRRNRASVDGGGLFLRGGTVTVSGAALPANTAGRDGGGIYNAADLDLDDSEVRGTTRPAGAAASSPCGRPGRRSPGPAASSPGTRRTTWRKGDAGRTGFQPVRGPRSGTPCGSAERERTASAGGGGRILQRRS